MLYGGAELDWSGWYLALFISLGLMVYWLGFCFGLAGIGFYWAALSLGWDRIGF